LSPSEFRSARDERREPSKAASFSRLDKNDDNQLTQAEGKAEAPGLSPAERARLLPLPGRSPRLPKEYRPEDSLAVAQRAARLAQPSPVTNTGGRVWVVAMAWGLVSALAFASACAPAAHGPAGPSPAAPNPVAPNLEPPKQGTLRVGTSGDYAPFSSRIDGGQLTGFDIELCEQLAHDLNLEIEWVTFHWPTLQSQVAQTEFDLAVGGITWQPARAVVGSMTRATARGGPCLVGDPAAPRIAVNHGGILETWARKRFPERELLVVDDNQSLPDRLTSAEVGAIVTDSFERRAFARRLPSNVTVNCEPALARKVLWLTPSRAAELGPRIDGWLREHTSELQAAQERWFGERQALGAGPHLVDLLARRMAFMPLIAGLKAQAGVPIEDRGREHAVLRAVESEATRLQLPVAPVVALFELQIALGKGVQQRRAEPSTLNLQDQIRPALNSLSTQILDTLAEARAARVEAGALDFDLLSPWLEAEERKQLQQAVAAVLQAPATNAERRADVATAAPQK
jgi:chorismate mutase